MGREMILPPCVCDIVRTAGAASTTASRTISSGGARVRECTQSSIRETVLDARRRLPWRMIIFVMNWRRGSSSGGMSKTGGGAMDDGVAEGGQVDGTAERGDKGAGWGVMVDRDLVIVERGRRRANNMAGVSVSQRCGRG